MIEKIEYNEDQKKVLSLLKGKQKTMLMVAPSFVVDFNYSSFVPTMKGLGFDTVMELTFGAKVVNEQYHKYIGNNKKKQRKFIASVCPMIVNVVKGQAPEMVPYLLPFDSPMVAMAKILHKAEPNQKIVFLAPCMAKKMEAKKTNLIDGVVTFKEMKEIVSKEKPKKVWTGKDAHLFDRFYNDFTKIYPLAGGLAATLHSKDILKKEEVFSKDNCKNVQFVFDKNSDKVFYDLLFCPGGCIGGSGVASKEPISLRRKKVLSYRKFAKGEKIGKRMGLNKYTKGLNFRTKFD